MSTRVRKGNKILKISDDAIDRYMSMGYSVIDAAGDVVNKATPSDTTTLKMEYLKMSEEIKGLKDEIKSLTDKNDCLTRENAKLAKELTALKSVSGAETTVTEKTTTTRRRKQSTENTTTEE